MSASKLRGRLAGALVALTASVSLPLWSQGEAEVLESDWLELVKGYKGSALGAELVEIKDEETGETREITLAIPKVSMRHPDEIEEVLVVGRMPEEAEPPEPLDITWEFVDDYDNDNYGLIIRLGKNSRWPIRLYMNSDPGFKR